MVQPYIILTWDERLGYDVVRGYAHNVWTGVLHPSTAHSIPPHLHRESFASVGPSLAIPLQTPFSLPTRTNCLRFRISSSSHITAIHFIFTLHLISDASDVHRQETRALPQLSPSTQPYRSHLQLLSNQMSFVKLSIFGTSFEVCTTFLPR